MNKLRLFTSPSAFPNPQRVRLLMHDKGIAGEIEAVVLDMAPGGEQRGWQHAKRNPSGETPTLELADGGYLAESVAIAIMGESATRRRWTSGMSISRVSGRCGRDSFKTAYGDGAGLAELADLKE